MTVISHLILNDMLKLRGEIVDICLLLESEDPKVKDIVNLFFYELGKKGNNVIYNAIPKALARISSEFKNLDYGRFQNMTKLLLKYVEKDKHTEGLIEKLFHKLKSSSGTLIIITIKLELIEWRNTTYCLSLLNYSDKHIVRLLEFYGGLKDKIEDDSVVIENFQNIFNKFKKTNQNKDMIDELEERFFKGEKIETKSVKEKMLTAKGKKRQGKKGAKTELESIKEEQDINEAEKDDLTQNYESSSENFNAIKVTNRKKKELNSKSLPPKNENVNLNSKKNLRERKVNAKKVYDDGSEDFIDDESEY